MEHILKGIPGVVVYQDDVICAADESQLQNRLAQVRNRLKERNVTINKEKSKWSTDSITFLGFTFCKVRIVPSKSLMDKILHVQEPTDKTELASFLGLINSSTNHIKPISRCDFWGDSAAPQRLTGATILLLKLSVTHCCLIFPNFCALCYPLRFGAGETQISFADT